MNRRKAIGRIILAGLGGGILVSGYKWYDWHKTPDLDWLQGHKDLVAHLSEAIIPATQTPGANEAGVADYILVMIRDATDRLSVNKFIDGLKELDHYCHSHYNHPFGQCDADGQRAVLAHFEDIARPYSRLAGKIENAYLGMPFFTTLKKLTAEGYCTSEAGATKGLRYDLVPGHYAGCIPLQPDQRAWATR